VPGQRPPDPNATTTLGVYADFVEESDREAARTLGALIAPSTNPDEEAS
jgi:hypothetical protein